MRTRSSFLRTSRYGIVGRVCLAIGIAVTSFALVSSPGASAATGPVGGSVFRDYDGDGIRSAEEPGVEGLWVRVVGQSAGPDATLGTLDDGELVAGPTMSDSSGAWSIPSVTSSGSRVRVEFLGVDQGDGSFDAADETLMSGFESAPSGVDSATSVQFVDIGSVALSYGIANPADFCGSNPRLVTGCFVGGVGTSSIKTLPWNSGYSDEATDLTSAPGVGSVWGLGVHRSSNQILAAAYVKRHVGLGDEGVGGLYALDATTGAVAWQLDLATRGVAVGTMPSNAVRGLGAPNAPSRDEVAFASAGRAGLGDIEVSEDDQYLYFTSLFDNSLYRLALNTDGSAPTGSATHVSGMPGTCDKPFGVSMRDGLVYVGKQCTTSSSGEFEIVAYDPESDSWSTPVPRRPTAVRNCTFITIGCGWNAWTDTWDPAWLAPQAVTHPQPFVADISFDNDGSIIVGFGDRFGDQVGNANIPPDGSVVFFSGMSAGDLVRMCRTGNSFAMENEPGCSAVNGSEWYVGDDPAGAGHGETAHGAVVQLPGATRVAATQMDATALHSGDVSWYTQDPTTSPPYTTTVDPGQRIRLADPSYAFKMGVQLYLSAPLTNSGTFGKANGLGDLQLLCDEAPIEIGNRVWVDANNNGVQDSDEAPLAGVTVTLTGPGGDSASTVTASDGTYYFSSVDHSWMSANTTGFRVSIDSTQPAIAASGYRPTVANLSGAIGGDVSDSDGQSVGSIVGAVVDLGRPGAHDHTIDFGFFKPYSLGNRVWVDADDDGVLDANEVGLDGATVSLLDAAGTPLDPDGSGPLTSTTTVTSNGGYYLFDGLAPGRYRVSVVAPTNYASSTPDATNPDDDTDAGGGSDNGIGTGSTAASNVVSIGINGSVLEPSGELDLAPIGSPQGNGVADNAGNMTVDFGFHLVATVNTTTTTTALTTTSTSASPPTTIPLPSTTVRAPALPLPSGVKANNAIGEQDSAGNATAQIPASLASTGGSLIPMLFGLLLILIGCAINRRDRQDLRG